MSAGTAQNGPGPAHLLFSHLDRVETTFANREGEPAEFSDGVPYFCKFLGMFLHQEFGAEVTARFFVGKDGENDVAQRLQAFGPGAQKSRQHHRHAALHVQRTPAPHLAVDLPALKRRMLPFLLCGCDDVHVSVEQQRGRSALAGQPGDQVGTVG